MRSQESLDKSFHNSKHWREDTFTGKTGSDVDRYSLPSIERAKLSLSGKERNSAFVKSKSGKFVNISGNSGLDSVSDGRCLARIDIDRDGLMDFLLTNANDRTLHIYHNRIGQLKKENRFVAIELVGGNQQNLPNEQFSNRNGIGAKILVRIGDRQQILESKCGEGLAAQNSSTLIVGLDNRPFADSIEIQWPSGKTSHVQEISSGSRVQFYENPDETDDGTGYIVSQYQQQAFSPRQIADSSFNDNIKLNLDLKPGKFNLVTSMATWCDSCKSHIPDIELLKNSIENLEILAYPIDPADSQEKLQEYVERHRPQYELLDASKPTTEQIIQLAVDTIGSADVPFSILFDEKGQITKILKGFPTVSDIQNLLSPDSAPNH